MSETDRININSPNRREMLTLFGPCSAESESQLLETARGIARNFPNNIFRAGIWKPRTRPGSFEGAGEKALSWMQAVRDETGMDIITEVATPNHVEAVLKAGFKHVWIGARTTVNPFSIQDLADSLQGENIHIYVKNPINPDVGLWVGACERFQRTGNSKIYAIHRGFQSFESSPYRNAPRWELMIDFKTQMPDVPVICDASHISGTPELIKDVAQKALDLDCDGLMIETHINPHVALTDASQQITPDDLWTIFGQLVQRNSDSLSEGFHRKLLELRSRVDSIDDAIIQSLIARKRLVEEIGEYKKANHVTILQIRRWEEILLRQLQNAEKSHLNTEFIKRLYELIHEESIRIQTHQFAENKDVNNIN
jgi:chorismate mutase